MEAGTQPLKDSGHRTVFDTGAQRDVTAGKGRYDLISPISLRRLALTMEKGAQKYSPRNWEQGIPYSRYVDSAVRHLMQWVEGHRDEDHLAQCFWNVHCLIHTEEMVSRVHLPGKLNDIPDRLHWQVRKPFSLHLEEASKTVSKWPEWKQTLLGGDPVTGIEKEVHDVLTNTVEGSARQAAARIIESEAWGPNKPLVIYVAGPYRSKSPAQVNDNIYLADELGRVLRNMGHYPIVPHTMTRTWDDEFTFPEIMESDLALLGRCDALF